MQIRPASTCAMIETLRRDGARGPWLAVLREVLDLAGPDARFVRHAERPWASVTFSGARHALRLVFEGQAAIVQGEAFIAALPEAEFELRGRLVADATVTGVEHDLLGGPRLVVDAELLVLDDA